MLRLSDDRTHPGARGPLHSTGGFERTTDAGVKEVAALKNLTSLSLCHTKVTDAGVMQLAALKNLTTLDLSETKVTVEGVKELQKVLPECKIERGSLLDGILPKLK